MSGNLKGKTIFITGGSRGIGLEIAKKAAADGANIAIAAKTTEPHPKLPGTIYTAAEEIEDAGGQALPCVVDVRDEDSVIAAVNSTAERFGGIDILINNASALGLYNTENTDMKRYDLMHNINTRGTFLCSQKCLPFLRKADNPQILNISPPLNLDPAWFSMHVAYTMAKYGMSMCVLGMAREFKKDGIGVNALWPRTAINTAAVANHLGGAAGLDLTRLPAIMADAAYEILTRNAADCTGNFFIDEEVLKEAGVTEFRHYQTNTELEESQLLPDFFLDVPPYSDELIGDFK